LKPNSTSSGLGLGPCFGPGLAPGLGLGLDPGLGSGLGSGLGPDLGPGLGPVLIQDLLVLKVTVAVGLKCLLSLPLGFQSTSHCVDYVQSGMEEGESQRGRK
jgi:hypothetical protein